VTTPPAPPPHPDDQLPAPLRWATRLFSSPRLVVALALVCGLYLVAAYLPIGGRYLWQAQPIDAPRSAVLGWTGFHVAWLLLACSIVWTAIRRLPWRPRNAGWFLAALGTAAAMAGWSTGWRFSTHGLLAVQSIADDATALQTRYLDPTQRVLTVQIGTSPPQAVYLDGLPLWHDAGPDTIAMPLHQHPGLRSQLDYRAQVHVVGYVADGTLTREADAEGRPTVTPRVTPGGQRHWPLPDCPPRALIGLRFTANGSEGPEGEAVVWLPFDLAAGQRVMPPEAYDIPGLGRVHLAFTLAGRDLGFAIAAEPTGPGQVTLNLVDTDPATRRIIPALTRPLGSGATTRYEPANPVPGLSRVTLTAGPSERDAAPRWVEVTSRPTQRFTRMSLLVAGAGLLVGGAVRLLGARRKPGG
jgi:hypothetical protein